MISLGSHCKTRNAQLPIEHQHYSSEVKWSTPSGWLPQGLPSTRRNSTAQTTQNTDAKLELPCLARAKAVPDRIPPPHTVCLTVINPKRPHPLL